MKGAGPLGLPLDPLEDRIHSINCTVSQNVTRLLSHADPGRGLGGPRNMNAIWLRTVAIFMTNFTRGRGAIGALDPLEGF